MAEKLYEYQGPLGRWHTTRDSIRESWTEYKEKYPGGCLDYLKHKLYSCDQVENQDFSHIYRRKTRKELIRISAAVMGIEFSYAAETAFVSPTLLKIGVQHKHMTLVWALSPLIGFFLTPILGSLSDKCNMRFGRRRPFIIAMSIGVLLGLILVPNGELIGYKLGDPLPSNETYSMKISSHRTSAQTFNYTEVDEEMDDFQIPNSHPWGVFFTILGTVLLDFDADACQSPARTYLLDVTIEDDHAKGLSTFTIMAGLGGFFGYALGGINWDVTALGILLGGHVRAVFTLITFIFVICVSYTLTSFKEMPLSVLESKPEDINMEGVGETYGAVDEDGDGEEGWVRNRVVRQQSIHPDASLITYLKSIIYMPSSLRILCLTNLFCWMAHVCYSLYFTDFVGESVFNGSPTALEGSESRLLYEEGVRFGCWGMSMYSLSCACYSMVIEKLIRIFGAKKVYVGGLLIYSSGMLLMALTKHKVGVILFSWTAGVMYSTLFTMPYLLVAHYHSTSTFETNKEGSGIIGGQVRGLGTDIALVGSMVFLAQFILSICMGTIVSLSGTTTAVVSVASSLAFCGAISATQIMYLNL
ncbi:PREDICTED: proton-associated sugar transporter A [Nicrophorus vespilloides]|uniref:Proton-associated sugar transporter A n=1 Tax=Nicrophorus vespilloides TaxID=110193 RepID=A0ABM1MHV4_NICVS|nr:PREDICTED: proton-associated sugar transporter A [Nicrophorus vespilloides]